MTNSNQNPNNKDYLPFYGNIVGFYTPHPQAHFANAQDVIHQLVESAKNISIATWNCFDDGETLNINHKIVAELIFEIQTKLEMIEKLLPMAFKDDVEG